MYSLKYLNQRIGQNGFRHSGGSLYVVTGPRAPELFSLGCSTYQDHFQPAVTNAIIPELYDSTRLSTYLPLPLNAIAIYNSEMLDFSKKLGFPWLYQYHD